MHCCLERKKQTGYNRDRCLLDNNKHIRVSSLRNRPLTGVQLAASLNRTCQNTVSSAAVKRCLLGRMSFTKLHMKPENKRE